MFKRCHDVSIPHYWPLASPDCNAFTAHNLRRREETLSALATIQPSVPEKILRSRLSHFPILGSVDVTGERRPLRGQHRSHAPTYEDQRSEKRDTGSPASLKVREADNKSVCVLVGGGGYDLKKKARNA